MRYNRMDHLVGINLHLIVTGIKRIVESILNDRLGKSLSVITLLMCAMLYSSCIDEIDLVGSRSGAGKMVIQGQLIKACPSYVSVQVSRSLDFRSRELPPPVSNASVYLRDDDGNEVLVPEVEQGSYRLHLNDGTSVFPVKTGGVYMISVTTSENENYISGMDTLKKVAQPDSISIKLEEREELDFNNTRLAKQYVQFSIHTPLVSEDRSERTYLRWTFNTIYQVTEPCLGPGCNPQTCFISRELGLEKSAVFNGRQANSDRLDHYMLVEDEAESRFGLGYLLKIKQYSLTGNAFRYWDEVNEVVSLSGGLFEAVPGKIRGNIFNPLDPEEEVYGYFYSSEEAEVTRFVKPSEVGRPRPLCDEVQNQTQPWCLNCTSIPNSTKEIPEGWEF